MSAVKNPKSKGSGYERDIAKKLSLWWSEGKSDCCIWRSASSGSVATQRAKQDKESKNFYGDLSPTDELAQDLFSYFVAELKRGYNKSNLLDVIDSDNECEFLKLWNQVIRDSILANRNPLLILKRDRKHDVIFLLKMDFNKFIEWCGYPSTKTISIHLENCDIIGLQLDSFLNWISPSIIRRMANEKELKTKKVSGKSGSNRPKCKAIGTSKEDK